MAPARPRSVRAPAFPEGLEWLNTAHPLTLSDLRGKFVLLDFWTYCCINCMHILPDLERLEEKYAEELVVIGVHSAKFINERSTERIRQAILRYNIAHPVVNDAGFTIWEQYAVRAWPTLYLIDPEGYVVGRTSGEGVFEPFDRTLQELIPQYEAEGRLNREPLAALLEREREPDRMLAFPGKVTAHEASSRLFITDTNHHRILVIDLNGRIQQQIGSGAPGLDDGALDEATFRQPQGTCFDATTETLYVADTENHALRRVDLRNDRVNTLAGTGQQAAFGTAETSGPGDALNSPWDVLLHDGRLYVAMAGPHQLWAFETETGRGRVYAGSGRENIVDERRLDAQLAQPSGLATDGTSLYFADSETSSLRRVPFGGEDAWVETLIGEGLFEFGDVDGRRPRARLQHPLGLAFHDGIVYIADTYNHKIKRYFPDDRAVATFLGTGTAGRADGGPNAVQFDEPGGLAVADGHLYIADTNNHRIAVAELETGRVRTMAVAEALETPSTPGRRALTPLQVAPGEHTVTLVIRLPEGYKPNELNTGHLTVHSADAAVARPVRIDPAVAFPTHFDLALSEGETHLDLDGQLYYCDADSGRCFLEPVHARVPVVVSTNGAGQQATAELTIAAP